MGEKTAPEFPIGVRVTLKPKIERERLRESHTPFLAHVLRNRWEGSFEFMVQYRGHGIKGRRPQEKVG